MNIGGSVSDVEDPIKYILLNSILDLYSCNVSDLYVMNPL